MTVGQHCDFPLKTFLQRCQTNRKDLTQEMVSTKSSADVSLIFTVPDDIAKGLSVWESHAATSLYPSIVVWIRAVCISVSSSEHVRFLPGWLAQGASVFAGEPLEPTKELRTTVWVAQHADVRRCKQAAKWRCIERIEMLSHVLRCFCKSKPAEPHHIVRRLWNVTSFTESCAQMSSRQFGDGSCTSSARSSVKGTSHDVRHCHHERLQGRWSEKCKRVVTTPGTNSIVDTLTLDLRGSLKAFRTMLRSYVGWSHGGDAARRRPCRHIATQCCGLHGCPTVACSPKHSSSSHSRPVTFFTYPFSPPSRSPASQQKPQRVRKRDYFRAPVVLHPKKCQSALYAGCDCQRDVTARICLFYALFYAFFFSLSLSLPRISRSDLRTRASTNAQLVYSHHGTDLLVGGFSL